MTCVCVFVCLAGLGLIDIGDASTASGFTALEEAYGHESVAESEASKAINLVDEAHTGGDGDGKYCTKVGCNRLIVAGPDGSFDCVYQGRGEHKRVTQLLVVIKRPCMWPHVFLCRAIVDMHRHVHLFILFHIVLSGWRVSMLR